MVRVWSFEPPGFGRHTLDASDHFFLRVGSVWHLFYTHAHTAEEPYRAIGHATSANLRDWTERSLVVEATPAAPAWRSKDVWAPSVATWPGGGWVMAITGVNEQDSQRVGFLFSEDLERWEERAEFPPLTPDTSRYDWSAWRWSDHRDPHLFFAGGSWHLLIAARTVDALPAVAHATSPDLAAWTYREPLLTVGTPGGPALESPTTTEHEGERLLLYTFEGQQLLRAPALSGPWDPGVASSVDPAGAGGELIRSGNGLLLSRRRRSSCDASRSVIWCDTLITSSWPYRTAPLEPLPGFPHRDGDAFAGQPTFGDTPGARGEDPSGHRGLMWLSSREATPEPTPLIPCGRERGSAPIGTLRSPPFVLAGDTASVRISGAVSPESLGVSLIEHCTGRTLARFVPEGATMTRRSVSLDGSVGARAHWLIEDRLARPGGWIGVDDLAIHSGTGRVSLPTLPALAWELPAGGEILSGGETVPLRWSATDPAGLDSLSLHVSYDGGLTLEPLGAHPASVDSRLWEVPDTLGFGVVIRLVAHRGGAAIDCLDSPPFAINATVDASPRPSPGRLEVHYTTAGPVIAGTVPSGFREAVLALFDLRGRRVARLWRGSGGSHFRVPVSRADAAGRRLPSGAYFARLSSEEGARTARILLVD